jgi:hypothetical protein
VEDMCYLSLSPSLSLSLSLTHSLTLSLSLSLSLSDTTKVADAVFSLPLSVSLSLSLSLSLSDMTKVADAASHSSRTLAKVHKDYIEQIYYSCLLLMRRHTLKSAQ